jgi:hypothetical protein
MAGAAPGQGAGTSSSSSSNADKSSSSSSNGDIPGNDGHIQIDQYVLDPGSDNDPHVGCGFSISFFGYDSGPQHATITIVPWAPTGGGHPATLGPVAWDVGRRTSGDQLDTNVQVGVATIGAIFAGVTPAAQGYHAKIEVEVTGSQGSDDKFHVIWIAPCSAGSGQTGGGSKSSGDTSGGGGGGGGTGGSGGNGGPGPIGGSGGNGAPSTSSASDVVGGSSGNGAPVFPAFAAAAAAAPVTSAPASQLPVLRATVVHTGEPWAGATPFETAALAGGLGCIGSGMRRRRRAQASAR